MNIYNRNKNKFGHLAILSIFISFSYNQEYPDGSFYLDQIFFQLNSLKIKRNFSKDSLSNGEFNLDLFKFGFDDISIKNKKNNLIELLINGPNINLENLEINTNYTLPNYYNLILSDLSDRRYETPMDGFEILEKALDAFKSKFNKYPKHYNDLVVESFINTSKYPFNQYEWSYNFELPNYIIATTTSMHKYPIKTITYDWTTKSIINRQSDQFDKKNIVWNIVFRIRDIKQNFLSDININLAPDNFNFEFYQRNGRFDLNGVSINAMQNNDIFEQSIFKLNKISLEINDLFFQLIKKNNEPNIQNGRVNFTIRNFELKIPQKLLTDETIKNIMQDLGVRNGLVRIRQLDFSIHFYDNEFGLITASFSSPFLKINFNGQISIDSKKDFHKSMDLFDTELRINPISYGVRDMIRKWEIDNNKDLKREGPVIVLKFTGPISKPKIIGID